MKDNVWVLLFHWYMGIDGSDTSIIGIFTTEELAQEAQTNYLTTHELHDSEYDSEWLSIKTYQLNSVDKNEC